MTEAPKPKQTFQFGKNEYTLSDLIDDDDYLTQFEKRKYGGGTR